MATPGPNIGPTRTQQAQAAVLAEHTPAPSHITNRGARPDVAPTSSGVKANLDDDAAAKALQKRNLFRLNAPTPQAVTREPLAPQNISADELQPAEDAPGLLNSVADEAAEDSDEPSDLSEVPANDEAGIQSLSDLAASLETDLPSLLSLRAATKIDGQAGDVSLGELLTSYQQQGHITRTQQALAEDRVKLNKEHISRLASVDKLAADTTQLLDVAKTILLGEYKDMDWDKLQAEDPVEFSGKYFRYQRQVAKLNEAIAQHTAALKARAEERQQSLVGNAQEEVRKLSIAMPQWADHSVAKADRAKMESYANAIGFAPEELAGVIDHRMIRVLYDAAQGAAMRTAKLPVADRTTSKSPNIRPGARTASGGLTSVNLNKARAALKTSGSTRDAAALLTARQDASRRRGR